MNKISVISTFWEAIFGLPFKLTGFLWMGIAISGWIFSKVTQRANLHEKMASLTDSCHSKTPAPNGGVLLQLTTHAHTHSSVIRSTPTSCLHGSPGLGWVTALQITRAYSGESEFSGKIISSLGVVKASLWEKTDKNTEWRGTYVWDR